MVTEIEARKRQSAALVRMAHRLIETIDLGKGNIIPTELASQRREEDFARAGWLFLRVGIAMIERGDAARKKADDWAAHGYPAGNDNPHVAGGDVADPTFANHDVADTWGQFAAEMDMHRTAAVHAANRLENQIHRLLRASPETVIPLAPAGSGQCQACEHNCTGAPNDRLRSGYCDPCRKAWERAGRPERVAFERSRRVPTEPAGHTLTRADVV